ncbi:MAG: ATP-binding cassette domain-containing protein [Bifidobacteriaceae bacterium]|jgi:putative ABC transport system ATP-binding protein|nr:ATP-binding cassette domain-containing protein [Bifidobacteriaceae bacterium]
MRLTIEDVTHRYGRKADRDALASVNLALMDGTATAIMGPSGSGKSTLLSVAAGLLEPSHGTAVLATASGRSASGHALRAETAWVFQAIHMLAKRSAADNVMLGCVRQTTSIARARERALAEIAKVGLAGRAAARIEELSGGEVQRVAVARAFAQDRPLIIADEPTAQLDRGNTVLVADALRAAARGRVVLVATHDEFLARQLHRIVRLRDGAVAADQAWDAGAP